MIDLGAVSRANWATRGNDVVLNALLTDEKIAADMLRRLLLESCYAFRRLALRDCEARAMLRAAIKLLDGAAPLPATVTEHPAIPPPERPRSTAASSVTSPRPTIEVKRTTPWSSGLAGPAGKLP